MSNTETTEVEHNLVNEAIAQYEFEEKFAKGGYDGYILEVSANWVNSGPFSTSTGERYLEVIVRGEDKGRGYRTEKEFESLVDLNQAFEKMVSEYDLNKMEPPWHTDEENEPDTVTEKFMKMFK